jgi:hypothetical protein
MKAAPLLLMLAMSAFGCKHTAPPVTVVEGTPPPPVEGPPSPPIGSVPLVTGTVTDAFARDGCAWLVQVDGEFAHPANGVMTDIPESIFPIALDPLFLRNGTRLRFTYRLSRANQCTCTRGTPAVLEHITVLP